MPNTIEVREVRPADEPGIRAMLAAAFHDDPVIAFIFPDPQMRRTRLPGFFDVIYKSDQAKGLCFVTGGGEAATFWRKPGHGHLSLIEMVAQGLPWIAAARTALPRALAFNAASDAAHPQPPYWYLHIAGCEPALQGKGFGGAAIRAGLARADTDGIPAYLETCNPVNLPLYRSLGFAVTKEWDVRNGPHCWSMLRPLGGDMTEKPDA